MSDLVKRLRNGFDNIPTVLEWEAADAIEELTAALQRIVIHDGAACEREGLAEFRELQDARALLSKYGASNG